MRRDNMAVSAHLPPEIEALRKKALEALKDVQPAGPPRSSGEGRALMLSSRTDGGRSLPPYYLVYFLLVDFLGYQDLGQWEKVAWIIPVRYQDRLYSVEHRKMGVGVFAPNHDPEAHMSGKPTLQAEADAKEIALTINKAVSIAEPYFVWRAEQAVMTSRLNVVNSNGALFERYSFFRNSFQSLSKEAKSFRDQSAKKVRLSTSQTTDGRSVYSLMREAKWNAQAAIEAFFGWTEHSFIHLAILQGRLQTGKEVAALAEADWKAKFKAALDLSQERTKQHYDALLDLRAQIRNFMAHGAFGKQGEAFRFHSGAGAVPVLLTQKQKHPFALTRSKAFDEEAALAEIDAFIEHLWSGVLAPAKIHIFSELPSILTYAVDGTYADAMQSEESMTEFVAYQTGQAEVAADMAW